MSKQEYGIVQKDKDGNWSLTEFGKRLWAIREEGKLAEYPECAKMLALDLRDTSAIAKHAQGDRRTQAERKIMTAQSWKYAIERSQNTPREKDIRLLDRLLALDLSAADEAFCTDVRIRLEDHPSMALSERQREIVQEIADRMDDPGEYENLVSSGKVPNTSTRVYDFETMKKPLAPPGRKT